MTSLVLDLKEPSPSWNTPPLRRCRRCCDDLLFRVFEGFPGPAIGSIVERVSSLRKDLRNHLYQGLLWSGRRDSNPRPSPWQGADFRSSGSDRFREVRLRPPSFQCVEPIRCCSRAVDPTRDCPTRRDCFDVEVPSSNDATLRGASMEQRFPPGSQTLGSD
jgi:hypothetical protein